MATFATPTTENTELAGPMSDLVGTFIGIHPMGTVSVKTAFSDQTPVLRAHIVNLETGDDAGVRLIYWSTVQRQVLDSTKNVDWAVGVINEQPQKSDPSRSVYLLDGDVEFDASDVSQKLDAVEL